MIESNECQMRVDQFKTDLKILDTQQIVRKHITTGEPFAITSDQYYELRYAIANEFQLHPSEVILVGSCRTGFSIAPKKRYQPVRIHSDLDVALISAPRFDGYWESVFRFSKSTFAWPESDTCQRFKSSLFQGWIEPRRLPPSRVFEDAQQWVQFFNGLMQSRQFGLRKITARLYRTWDRLESYQEIAVRKCKAQLEGSRDE